MGRDNVNLETSRIWVNRRKGSLSVEQPIAGDELRAIKRYLATRTDSLPWLFVSERGTQLTRQAVNFLIACIANDAGLPKINPHMLRHSCGYYLADKATDLRTIQDNLEPQGRYWNSNNGASSDQSRPCNPYLNLTLADQRI